MQDNPSYTMPHRYHRFFSTAKHAFTAGRSRTHYCRSRHRLRKSWITICRLLQGLTVVEIGFPVLLGASRKSMFGQLLDDRGVEGRLAGTLAAHYHGLMQGVRILRVHDVQEAVIVYGCLKLYKRLNNQNRI